ncbi:hypothetical protein BDM02DRAFT_3194333 [Thelephora ganbajun]|uniref:Uncharacterized protein n=1 Tax=Thelephora ganbajun TaxID=370292 RepID=A0ACB6YX63_THEGA|nr:hypothetical protein BDM02DRAFT_3194333 [Thelephora ganbajun]
MPATPAAPMPAPAPASEPSMNSSSSTLSSSTPPSPIASPSSPASTLQPTTFPTQHSYPPLSSHSMRETNQILEVRIQTLHSPEGKEDKRMFQEVVIEEDMGVSQSSLPGGHFQEATLVKGRREENDQDTMVRHKGPFNIRGKLEIKTANLEHDEMVGWMEDDDLVDGEMSR